MLNDTYFSVIPCPLCKAEGYTVIYPGNFPDTLSEEFLRDIYRSSSEHSLFEQVVKCKKCSLVYLNPRLREELIVGSYAEGEDRTFILQDQMRIRTFRHALRKLKKKYPRILQSEKKVLDIGCAGGAFLRAAQIEGFKAIGIEPSKWLGEYGRREHNLDIRTGVLSEQQFPEKSFDMVTMWDVIEHVPDPTLDLRRINSLLKDDGIFVVNYPDFGSLPARILGKKWPFLLSVHLVYYTPRTIRKQLETAGFQVVSLRRHWQILELGYVLKRAGQYFSLFTTAEKLVTVLGIQKIPLIYWIGQTQVIAKKC